MDRVIASGSLGGLMVDATLECQVWRSNPVLGAIFQICMTYMDNSQCCLLLITSKLLTKLLLYISFHVFEPPELTRHIS